MTTGMHVVADIACAKCLNVVGWKYVSTLRPASGNMVLPLFSQHTHQSQLVNGCPGSHDCTLHKQCSSTPSTCFYTYEWAI